MFVRDLVKLIINSATIFFSMMEGIQYYTSFQYIFSQLKDFGLKKTKHAWFPSYRSTTFNYLKVRFFFSSIIYFTLLFLTFINL